MVYFYATGKLKNGCYVFKGLFKKGERPYDHTWLTKLRICTVYTFIEWFVNSFRATDSLLTRLFMVTQFSKINFHCVLKTLLY